MRSVAMPAGVRVGVVRGARGSKRRGGPTRHSAHHGHHRHVHRADRPDGTERRLDSERGVRGDVERRGRTRGFNQQRGFNRGGIARGTRVVTRRRAGRDRRGVRLQRQREGRDVDTGARETRAGGGGAPLCARGSAGPRRVHVIRRGRMPGGGRHG